MESVPSKSGVQSTPTFPVISSSVKLVGTPNVFLCWPRPGTRGKVGAPWPVSTSPRAGSTVCTPSVTGSPTLVPPARIIELTRFCLSATDFSDSFQRAPTVILKSSDAS